MVSSSLRCLAALLLGVLLIVPSTAIAAGRKVALVIGNSAYRHTPQLANPRNDASEMAAVLGRYGFQVISGLDLDKAAFDLKVREFAEALSGADAGIFFYAGHGLQSGGQNYLIPIDAKLASGAGLDFETVRLDLVQRTMERETKTSIIFLDACRDNPLARGLARSMGTRSAEVGRGLASTEAGIGTLISFATQPGNVALDGTGRNSPYAGALARQIGQSSDDLGALLISVRNEVIRATDGKQVPWEHSSLTGRFYFRDGGTASAPAPVPSLPSTPSPPQTTGALGPAKSVPPPSTAPPGLTGVSNYCGYNSGPKYGRIERFNFAQMIVGGPCHDGRGSFGVAIAEPGQADLQRLQLDQRLWSNTCRFSAGPKAGQVERYPQFGSAQVGTPCNDGIGSFGVVVPEG